MTLEINCVFRQSGSLTSRMKFATNFINKYFPKNNKMFGDFVDKYTVHV